MRVTAVVGVAEEVKVVEQRVEVVEVAALGVAGVQGAGFLVGIIEFAREAAEELGRRCRPRGSRRRWTGR